MSSIRTLSPAGRHKLAGLTLVPLFLLAASSCGGSQEESAEATSSDVYTEEATIGESTDESDDAASGEIIDIQDAILTERSGDCGDYVNTYVAEPVDLQNDISFMSTVVVTATDTHCTFASNSVPNHDFNDETAAFAGGAEGATITETETLSVVTRTPELAAEPTYLSTAVKNAIMLNGVRLDQAAAGCYDPTSNVAGEDGNTPIGCQSTDPWVLDPPGTESGFGVDLHNGHTQPGGLYHYHANPNAMFDDNPGPEGSPVIGFAADGFPIFGSYFLDSETGEVRKAISGYTLLEGSRGTRSDTNPGGDYDGEYVDDWEFTDAGDLDECNGMTVDGQYGYYVTDSYPWVMACLSGTPDESFLLGGQGGGDAGPGEDGAGPDDAGADGAGQAGPGEGGPDFTDAAAALGVTVEQLQEAIGTPPDFEAAAETLGFTVEELYAVLPEPPGGFPEAE